MHSRELLEADYGSFAGDAAKAVSKFADYASSAASKLKNAHSQAISDKDTVNLIPRLIAKICVSLKNLNDESVMAPILSMTVNQQKIAISAINKAHRNLSVFPGEMRKILLTKKFLSDAHKNKNTLNAVLGRPSNDTIIEAKKILQADKFDEQSAWADILTLGDQTALEGMFQLIAHIGKENAKHNVALQAAGKRKERPETLGVVKLFSSQRQVLSLRLETMKRIIEKTHSAKKHIDDQDM